MRGYYCELYRTSWLRHGPDLDFLIFTANGGIADSHCCECIFSSLGQHWGSSGDLVNTHRNHPACSLCFSNGSICSCNRAKWRPNGKQRRSWRRREYSTVRKTLYLKSGLLTRASQAGTSQADCSQERMDFSSRFFVFPPEFRPRGWLLAPERLSEEQR